MNPYPGMSAINYTRHDPVQGFVRHSGPWDWQWRGGVRDLVLVPPSSKRIPVKDLMDGIEQALPGMYRTITDLGYSRSPQCPFIIDEISMKELRSRLYKYEDQSTLLSPDAQTGLRKSIAAALGERKGSTPSAHTVAYPSSVDVERSVYDPWGPRQWFGTLSVDETDSGSDTMSNDSGTVRGTPSDGSRTPTKATVSLAYKKVKG